MSITPAALAPEGPNLIRVTKEGEVIGDYFANIAEFNLRGRDNRLYGDSINNEKIPDVTDFQNFSFSPRAIKCSRKKVLYDKVCANPDCGKSFQTYNMRQKYCNATCCQNHGQKRAYERRAAAKMAANG